MAARKKAEDTASELRQSDGYRMTKLALLLLLLMDLAALGAFVFVQTVKLDDANKTLAQNERGVVRARKQMRDIIAVAASIRNNQLVQIDDPGGVIMSLAQAFGLQGKVKAGKNTTSNWKSTRYEEVTVPITFIEKEGYKFGDLISFLEKIERKNPKLQIKAMNFGQRQSGIDPKTNGGYDWWRPTGPALVVRTFRLKS